MKKHVVTARLIIIGNARCPRSKLVIQELCSHGSLWRRCPGRTSRQVASTSLCYGLSSLSVLSLPVPLDRLVSPTLSTSLLQEAQEDTPAAGVTFTKSISGSGGARSLTSNNILHSNPGEKSERGEPRVDVGPGWGTRCLHHRPQDGGGGDICTG